MKKKQKEQIKKALEAYVARFDAQGQASRTLKGVSSATISQMLNYHWESISPEMWRNVAAQIGYEETPWNGVQTRDFKLLTALLKDAQKHSDVFAVIGKAGTGKTYCLKQYAMEHRRAYLLCCNEYWNRKYFLTELLRTVGSNPGSLTMADMAAEAVRHLKVQERPILILDEADKLKDVVLYFFITIYNQLEGRCAIIMCATDYLKKRLEFGLKRDKKGYPEIWSRIGGKPFQLDGLSLSDVIQVCTVNGVEDKNLIKEIYTDSNGDLRRVKRKVDAVNRCTSDDLNLFKRG